MVQIIKHRVCDGCGRKVVDNGTLYNDYFEIKIKHYGKHAHESFADICKDCAPKLIMRLSTRDGLYFEKEENNDR